MQYSLFSYQPRRIIYSTDLLLSKDCSVCFVFSINSVWLASDLPLNVFRCDCALYFPVSIKVRKESNVLYFKVCFPLLIVKIMSCSAISEYVHFVQMLTTKNACAQNTILVPSPLPSQNTEHSCSFLVRWIFNRVQLHFLIRIDSMFEFSVVPNISSLVWLWVWSLSANSFFLASCISRKLSSDQSESNAFVNQPHYFRRRNGKSVCIRPCFCNWQSHR